MSLKYVILLVAFGVCLAKEKRSVGIFAAKSESPLSHHQVWKVHKYSGVELKPVNAEHEYVGETHYSDHVPKTVHIPDHYEDDHGFVGRSNDYGTTLPEEKVGTAGIIPSLVLKKKKKLGLAAISNLINSKHFKWHKGGAGVLGGLFGSEEDEGYPYPAQTSVYRDVPTSSGFFSRIPFLNGFHKGHVVHLPEPSIPHIPALKLVPEAPQLPKLGFSTHYKLPYSTGSYVSIRAPKPHIKHQVYSPPVEYVLPEKHYKEPEIEYGLPHSPAAEFAPYTQEAPYPPVESAPYSPPAPAPEYGLPSYKYSGPSSYQTSFDHTHHAEKRQSTDEETEKETEKNEN